MICKNCGHTEDRHFLTDDHKCTGRNSEGRRCLCDRFEPIEPVGTADRARECEHPQSSIQMNGICQLCRRQVRLFDCDCGACNFCLGDQTVVRYTHQEVKELLQFQRLSAVREAFAEVEKRAEKLGRSKFRAAFEQILKEMETNG